MLPTMLFAGLCLLTVSHICHSFTIDQIIANATPHADSVMYDENSNTVTVELDMVFTIKDWNKLIALNNSKVVHKRLQKRQAIHDGAGGRYWPNGVIYYEIAPYDFSPEDVKLLHEAMDEWMRYTCVQFLPATRHTRYKVIFVAGSGCSSNVGMVDDNRVTLSKGCLVKGVIIHELGHVLGFHHEQTRPDRDHYVKIHLENIPPHLRYNFRKYSTNVIRDIGVLYDYLSIMHYGKTAFSANGEMTIETIDRRYQDKIGNRRGLSFRDIKSANILYNCKPICELRDEDCPGEAFVGKDCKCWCPSKDVYRAIPYYHCQPVEASESTDRDRFTSHRNFAGSRLCKDKHHGCKSWASRGECRRNRAYMELHCRQACGLCPRVTSRCQDKSNQCDYWHRKGYCDVTSDFYRFMAVNCKLSCGLCPTLPGPGSKILPCERKCQNDHENCEMWARRGECIITSDYMLRYCRKACRTCCLAGSFRIRTRGLTTLPKPQPTSPARHQTSRGSSSITHARDAKRKSWGLECEEHGP